MTFQETNEILTILRSIKNFLSVMFGTRLAYLFIISVELRSRGNVSLHGRFGAKASGLCSSSNTKITGFSTPHTGDRQPARITCKTSTAASQQTFHLSKSFPNASSRYLVHFVLKTFLAFLQSIETRVISVSFLVRVWDAKDSRK